MEHFTNIFSDCPTFQLYGMLAGVLSFAILGIKSLIDEQVQGYLYLLLSLLFFIFHWYLLQNVPSDSSLLSNMTFARWLLQILAPALILVLLAIGFFDLLNGRSFAAVIKTGMGLSLTGILYAVGRNWSNGVQFFIILLWVGIWIRTELKIAR